MTQLEDRAVAPFYLQMMRDNAVDHAAEVWSELVAVGRGLEVDDATWLLNVGEWRAVVMGAWFSTRFAGSEIGPALRRAMAASGGSLTAGPLAVACVVVAGADALPEMRSYVESERAQDGSAGLVAAGVEHLGGAAAVAATDDDRRSFDQLLDRATRLGAALSGSR